MCRLKRMILCIFIVSLCACGKANKSDDYAAIYGETIGDLEDNELFAIIEINADHPVLLVASQVYDDGMGNQAAMTCDVYYLVDGKVKNIGQVKSFGTAYPVAYDKTGIYAASILSFSYGAADTANAK